MQIVPQLMPAFPLCRCVSPLRATRRHIDAAPEALKHQICLLWRRGDVTIPVPFNVSFSAPSYTQARNISNWVVTSSTVGQINGLHFENERVPNASAYLDAAQPGLKWFAPCMPPTCKSSSAEHPWDDVCTAAFDGEH